MQRDNGLICKLWLILVFGAGNRRINELTELFDGDLESLRKALSTDSKLKSSLSPYVLSNLGKVRMDDAEAMLDKCSRFNVDVIADSNPEYPERLKNIPAPPVMLFCKGDISKIDASPTMAMVGARKPSEYSRHAAESFAAELARNGISVVSGFAEGIDICASLSAVRNGGTVYEVVGAGLDIEYPKSNMIYREKICEHGAIITEFPPGTDPMPRNFPQRNRILTALSDTVAVIEASNTSGSLNTASHAADLGVPVFVIPPMDIFDERYFGNVALLRDGAIPLMGKSDLAMYYDIELADTSADVRKPPPEKPKKPASTAKKAKKTDTAAAPDKKTTGTAEATTAKKADKTSADKAADISDKPDRKAAPKKEKAAKATKADMPSETTRKKAKKEKAAPKPSVGDPDADRILGILSDKGTVPLAEISERSGIDTDKLLVLMTELELDDIVSNDGTGYMIR